MTREALLNRLRELEEVGKSDEERAHVEADDALLSYINDCEITKAFEKINKWYA